MGITGDDLSDKDTRLAQAEVFALSEGERRGQRPAIDVLRALALSLRSCIYTGTHQLFPTRVLAQLSRL